jgi:hypothetical protein
VVVEEEEVVVVMEEEEEEEEVQEWKSGRSEAGYHQPSSSTASDIYVFASLLPRFLYIWVSSAII